jgi:hypothetical protein
VSNCGVAGIRHGGAFELRFMNWVFTIVAPDARAALAGHGRRARRRRRRTGARPGARVSPAGDVGHGRGRPAGVERVNSTAKPSVTAFLYSSYRIDRLSQRSVGTRISSQRKTVDALRKPVLIRYKVRFGLPELPRPKT